MPHEKNTVTHGTASLLFLLALLHAQGAAATVASASNPTRSHAGSGSLSERLAAVRSQLEIGKTLAPSEADRFRGGLQLAAWEDSWVNFNDGAYWEDIWTDFSN